MTSFLLMQFLRFQLKAENSEGGGGDDTALDLIKLMCNEGHSVIYGKPQNTVHRSWLGIYSTPNLYDLFGKWCNIYKCSQYYTGAEFR